MDDVDDLYYKFLRKSPDMVYHGYIIEVPTDEILYKLYTEDRNYMDNPLRPSRFLSAIKYWGTPSSYKKIKNRLSELVSHYDGLDFKAPHDIVEALAEQINSSKLEPYPINVEIRPTSVCISFRFTKNQLKNLDLDQINSNIDEYVESLKSLPLVGKIYAEHAHMPDDFLTSNLKTHYIKVVPIANIK